MREQSAILRRWTGRILKRHSEDYVEYIKRTGLRDYLKTPGNLGCQMLLRDLEDGSTEVTTLSWWDSLESIAAFAGADFNRAVYYPEDDQYLIERPLLVEHHRVAAGTWPVAERVSASACSTTSAE